MTRNVVPRSITTADAGWQLEAACRGLDTESFYSPVNERGSSRRRRERIAKTVCATCLTVAPCLSWAMATGEAYGVWGGFTAKERAALNLVKAAQLPA